MKLTRKQLRVLIESFISGPKGTINLDDPYEYLDTADNPKLSRLRKDSQAQAVDVGSTIYPEFEEHESYVSDTLSTNTKSAPSHETSNDYARLVKAYDDPNFESTLMGRIDDISRSYDIHEDDINFVRQGIIEDLAADYPIYNIGQLTVQDEEKLPEGVSTIDSIVSDYLVAAGFSAADDEYDWELDADNDRWGI